MIEKTPLWVSEKRSDTEINNIDTSLYAQCTTEKYFSKLLKFVILLMTKVGICKFVK